MGTSAGRTATVLLPWSPALAPPRSLWIPGRPWKARRAPVVQGGGAGAPAPAAAASAPAAAATAKAAEVDHGVKTAEVDHVALVLEELAAKKKEARKLVVVQTAPTVRVSIGEEVGLPPGAVSTGKLVAALRRLGFDYVFDTLVGADLTIMEEGTELLERLHANLHGDKSAGPLPMFTSCCPGWVNFVEACAPDLLPFVSSCKSPHMMVGAMIKRHLHTKLGLAPADISVVSLMPCVKKQGEADRIMFQTDEGIREVDHVITTRDLGQMLRQAGIDFEALPEEEYDELMPVGTGAAAIFGTTGGVMEAALRTVVDVATGQAMPRLVYHEVRGLEGVKEATVTLPPNPDGPLGNTEPLEVRVAVANGLACVKKLVKAVEAGEANYHFIECMACPGGCIGGGGQPRSKDKDILKKRQAALYSVDERAALRRSHENPVVQGFYKEFLGAPGSEEAHHSLHTTYVPCGAPKFDITAPPPTSAAPACDLPEACEPSEVCSEASSSEGSSASESDSEAMAARACGCRGGAHVRMRAALPRHSVEAPLGRRNKCAVVGQSRPHRFR